MEAIGRRRSRPFVMAAAVFLSVTLAGQAAVVMAQQERSTGSARKVFWRAGRSFGSPYDQEARRSSSYVSSVKGQQQSLRNNQLPIDESNVHTTIHRNTRTIFKGKSNPTEEPTMEPSRRPTTLRPTRRPSQEPTRRPTHEPTRRPVTRPPTRRPSHEPTRRPTNEPTRRRTTGAPQSTPPTSTQAQATLEPSLAVTTISPTQQEPPSLSPAALPTVPMITKLSTKTLQMVMLPVETNLLTDQYAFDWEQATSDHIRRFWNDQQTQSPIYIIMVETILLSRVRLTANNSKWKRRRTLANETTSDMSLQVVASYPLLVEYNQSIAYSITQRSMNDSQDDWIYRKPFVNANESVANYMAQLTALINNSQPIQLDSLSIVPSDSGPDSLRNATAIDDIDDDVGTDDAANDGMSRPIASIVAITVVLTILCVILLTCRCE